MERDKLLKDWNAKCKGKQSCTLDDNYTTVVASVEAEKS